MRILACPSDAQGCGRYRLGLPIQALQDQEKGLEIKLSRGLPVKYSTETGEAIALADEASDFDVIVLQRPMSRDQVIGLRDARRRGIRTVVEIDDDFHALHALSPAHLLTHPRVSGERNRSWLGVACREADLVTVSTPALARRYAPHGRVRILRNRIPAAWLEIGSERSGGLVGWTGTVGTHHDDLPQTRGGVATALGETGGRFRVIGHSEMVREGLGLREEPELAEWTSWENYPREIAQLDVGIAPLVDTAFNRAKSGNKPLEYAALGVPSVISPLPEYERLHGRGIGVLAKSRSRDWHREVKRLLADDAYRIALGEASRETAAEETIEEHCWMWAEAWTEGVPVSV